MRHERSWLGGALGLVGVAGNVVGVGALWGMAGAYRPEGLAAWVSGALANPGATLVSSVAFTVGLLALAGWAIEFGRGLTGEAAPLASGAMAVGAVLNAAGTLAPAVLVLHVAPGCAGDACEPVARALLGLTLSLDALFNLSFGAGLTLTGWILWRGSGRRALGGLGLAAGAVTMLVFGQLAWDRSAQLLAVAGPLWLVFVSVTSVSMWRQERAPDTGEE